MHVIWIQYKKNIRENNTNVNVNLMPHAISPVDTAQYPIPDTTIKQYLIEM